MRTVKGRNVKFIEDGNISGNEKPQQEEIRKVMKHSFVCKNIAQIIVPPVALIPRSRHKQQKANISSPDENNNVDIDNVIGNNNNDNINNDVEKTNLS